MKKIIKICFYFGLASILNFGHAFEFPPIPEGGIADRMIQWVKRGGNYFENGGIANFILNVEERGVAESTILYGPQIAFPLIANHHYLTRLEINGLFNSPSEDKSILKEHLTIQYGLSGRYIINSRFIWGGYLLGDYIDPNENNAFIKHMLNLGFEGIWPQYGGSITIDAALPFSIFTTNDYHKAYQGSIKFTTGRPLKYDFSLAFAVTKYPCYEPKGRVLLGTKFRCCINKWKANKWLTFGLKGTYTKRAQSWTSIRNFGGGGYLQINFLWQKPHNSLRDYLRMPIDRHTIAPYYPGYEGYDEYRSSIPAPDPNSLSSSQSMPFSPRIELVDSDNDSEAGKLKLCEPKPMEDLQ